MLISKKIRLEVSDQDAATLEFMQGKCRGLYNWWVMCLRTGEKWPGWESAKKTLQASKVHDPELRWVYGKLLHEVYFRLDGAMTAFFRRVKASHLIAHKLVERTIVVGDVSQRQLAMKAHRERNKHLNQAVFNEWGLYTFMQMLLYKCQLYGKDLHVVDERNTSKRCSGCGHLQDMPLWKRTYCCVECGLIMDRDENSAVNILMRFLARLGPHTGDPVRCAAVFTAIDNVVHTLEHI